MPSRRIPAAALASSDQEAHSRLPGWARDAIDAVFVAGVLLTLALFVF